MHLEDHIEDHLRRYESFVERVLKADHACLGQFWIQDGNLLSSSFLCQWAKPLSGFVLCRVVAGVLQHFGQVHSLGAHMICFARRCLEEIKDAAAILEESGIWVNRASAKHFGTGFLWFSFLFNDTALVAGALKQVQSPQKEYWSSAEGHRFMLQETLRTGLAVNWQLP